MISLDIIDESPTLHISKPILLESYLECLNQPALILSYPSLHLSKSPTPSTLIFANSNFLNLCGIQEFTKSTNWQGLIVPKYLSIFSTWLQEVSSSVSSTTTTCTIRLYRESHKDAVDIALSEQVYPTAKEEEIEVEWSGVCVNKEGIVLTGSVRSDVMSISTSEEGDLEDTKTTEEGLEVEKSTPVDVEPSCRCDEWRKVPQLVSILSGGGEMGEMLRSYHWCRTPLGPVIKWSQSLLTTVSMCMTSTLPMALWWGPKFTILYNDAYRGIAGEKHPAMFGMEGRMHWEELWEEVGPMANLAMEGTCTYVENDLLFMTRKGFLEETYITWSYVPIRQEDGTVGGFLNPYVEATERMIAERRLKTLRDIGAETGVAKSANEVYSAIGSALAKNPYDITFGALYMHSTERDEDLEDSYGVPIKNKTISDILYLTKTIGITEEHPSMFAEINLSSSFVTNKLKRAIKLAHDKRMIVTIDLDEWFGEIPVRGWETPARQAVVSPILGSTQEGVLGVLVMGLNARTEYNEDYEGFVDLVCRQTGSAIMSIYAYEEEVRRFKELAAIDRAKTAFFSSVSHELRTPLTLILGPVQDLLLEKDLARETKTKITYVYRNAGRLLRLVNLLLDFSKIEAGKMQATFQETNLAKFTADLASMFRSAIEKGGVKFEVECEEKDYTAWVDRDMWEKIVFNLIGNAFKFTLKGSITVSLQPSADQSNIVLSVSDTGNGIPTHELSRVFERFHRVEGRLGRSHEGTGIGLALTQELAKLHGGSVDVTSEFGKGSTFSVQIPLGNAHLPKDRLMEVCADNVDDESSMDHPCMYGRSFIEEARNWLPLSDEESTEYVSNTSSTESNAGGSITFPVVSRGCRVLLVDDNVDMRKYVKSILDKWWKVTEASDGEEAYQMAIADPPDLIVSDVMMPNVDGFGLLKILRTQPLTKLIPVILLSAQAGEEARVDGLNAGADDYLVKPFSAKELVARVHTHLELGKLRIELERMVKERTKELIASELRYKSLTKLSPVGIFRADLDGRVTYTNDKWWKISGHNRERDPTASDFLSSVHPDDLERASKSWKDAITEIRGDICEFRWRWPNGEARWCLNEMIVHYDEDRKPCGFVGAITDLTDRKILEKERLSAVRLAEQQQRHRAEEAEEVKRQQEIYIDMTCHELRNPLNGIYHSADLLHESLEKVQKEVRKESIKKVANWLENEITSDLDVIDTITLCAQHQKKIADDVLHMSKINMNLLVLSKTNMRPISVVSNVIRMFETEVRLKEIALEFTVADGYSQLDVDWVKGDPTRFTQILINFLTNAIRFTERVPLRRITVTLDALDKPSLTMANEILEIGETQAECGSPVIGSDVPSDVSDISGRETSEVPTTALLDAVYIAISIKDSGVGMTIEEQSNLFQRFAQGTPRTYAEFGGSGLGLFISKRLVELHDGKITVESKKGDGTTFSFYIKCERVEGNFDNDTQECPSGETDTGVMEYTYTEPHKPPVDSLRTKDSPTGEKPLGNKNTSVKKKAKSKKQPKLSKEKKDTVVWIKSSPTEKVSKFVMNSNDVTRTKECSMKPNASVLVVEDNLINQRVLKRQLELAGFTAGVAKHGAEALDILKETSYHLILMDLEMPVMGGLECTRRIREIEKASGSRYIPIVGVSGNAREEYRCLAIESGMTDYVIKPYDKQELLVLVATYIQKFN